MKPKIIQKGAMLIAGVAGSGDETAKAWETLAKIQKMNPLKNQAGETGYEVRMYPGEGPGKIHVGVQVKDAGVPAEYKIFFIPAATYAEFEIYPAKGYESRNAEMSKWLEDNAETYQPGRADGMLYGIEVYDKRYKGEKDPKSAVGFWQPITPAGAPFKLIDMIAGPLGELGGHIEELAGAEAREKAMAGRDEILAEFNPAKTAVWMRGVMNRLEGLAGKKTCEKMMTACGKSCNKVNHKDTEECRQMRSMCATEEDYIEKFVMSPGPGNGVRYEREGKTLIQYYTPGKYKPGLRCYCSLVNALPANMNISTTYCQCARSFTQSHWEAALGRPVKVELGPTALTGADECKFTIHL